MESEHTDVLGIADHCIWPGGDPGNVVAKSNSVVYTFYAEKLVHLHVHCLAQHY